MTCYLLHWSLYLTRLTEAQLVCADLCWWDEGISHTEVWLSQKAVTQPEHMEGTWKVWLLVLESHSGVSPVWGSVLTDCECNSNAFQNAALHFSLTAMSEFGVCAFMIQDDPACVTALKAKQTSVLSCCNPQWQPACCLCCELEQ